MCCQFGNGCTSVFYDPRYHGSQLWRPSLKDTVNLESSKMASKYALSDYTSTNKDHLIELGLLPLVMYLKCLDISFLLRCLKDAGSDNFNINSFVSFATQSTGAAQCYPIHFVLVFIFIDYPVFRICFQHLTSLHNLLYQA